MKNNIPKPVRILLAVLSAAFIVWMWVKKDAAGIYAAMPPEAAIPMIVTGLAVSLGKAALIAGGILLIKWILGKIGGMKQ